MSRARTVLICDSNARASEQLSASFARTGYDAVCVPGAQAVVDIWRGGAAFLAVVDNSSPPFVGLELAVQLKRQASSGHVVGISSAPSVAMAVQAMRMGLDSFLAKPTSAVEILASIRGDMGSDPPRPLTLDEAIWEHISQTMVSSGTVAEASRRLGVERRSLRRMVAKYGPKR